MFTLHESFEAAQEDTLDLSNSSRYEYVTYFDGSVRGLSPGAPVEFKGVQIGRVTDIKLMYDEIRQSVRVPVHIEFQPERLLGVKGVDSDDVNRTIARGLQAKLQMGNLLTGQLFVSLENIEGDPVALQKNDDGLPVLPSVKSDLGQLTEGVQTALTRINELPLDDLFANASDTVFQAQQLLADINGLGLAGKIDGTFGSVDGAVQEYSKLATTVGLDFNRLSEQLKLLVATADESIEGIAPDSPLYYNMLNALRDFQQASRSVQALSESVEKKPEEFIFGK